MHRRNFLFFIIFQDGDSKTSNVKCGPQVSDDLVSDWSTRLNVHKHKFQQNFKEKF